VARRRRSNRALSRRQRAILVGLGLIATALLAWLDRYGISLPGPGPSTSRQQTLATDLARYHGRSFEVVRVVDGDTLHLGTPDLGGDSTKVRLLGIDAPEMGTNRSERMYFAEEATASAKRLALGQTVRVYLDERAGSRDRYQRLLAYIELPDGKFLNEELLSEGYAYADRRFRHSYYQKYLQLEAGARSLGKGLWKDVTPEQMPPWLQKRLNHQSSIDNHPSSQVVLPDLAVERALADPQDLGGLLAIALCPGQRVGDGLLLQLVQGNAGQTRRGGTGPR
jgi:endonuclease YncB( thermonuclease family)